jgi:hypothetical protein
LIIAAASGGPELNTPTNGTEWAELIVKEMLSASDMIDAKNRAFRILELLEKSTSRCITPDEQKMREVTNASAVAWYSLSLKI